MEDQKHLFTLHPDEHYLNCAYKAPLLKSSEAAGISALKKNRNPSLVTPADFFSTTDKVKKLFANLIGSTAQQVAICSGTSYGFANALNNISPKENGNVIIVEEEFPSGYFAANNWCEQNKNELLIIDRPDEGINRNQDWNTQLIEAINNKTSFVLVSSAHWMDGTLFNLKEIGKKCTSNGAKLIVDGTQSVGILPMKVKDYHIDVLVCATYKWLFGPYGIALAYFSEEFNHGNPIEHSWLNKSNARNFSQIIPYNKNFDNGATRYDMAEKSNFIQMAMLLASLQKLADWKTKNILQYVTRISSPFKEFIENQGIILPKSFASAHIISYDTSCFHKQKLDILLKENKIHMSVRANSIRTSFNVFNTNADVRKLINVLTECLN